MRTFLEGVAVIGIGLGLIWLFGSETDQMKGAIFIFGGVLTFMGDILAEKISVAIKGQKAMQEKLDQMITLLTAIQQQNKDT